MTTYGATTIPVTAPANPEDVATGDPALDVWAAYFKAYVNAYGLAAWAKVYPRAHATQIPPILQTFTHQPTDETIAPFNERYLPCLFLFRSTGGAQQWEWLDGRVARDTITALWVFPTGTQPAERIRVPYCNALVKLIDTAIEQDRDPCYVHPGDTDPTAASIAADPDAIKTAIATATTQQTYSGVALNGATGGSAFVQPRAFTATLAGTAGDFVDGSTITVTGLDVLGMPTTQTLTITTGTLPVTFSTGYAFTQITQIAIEAQGSTAGQFTFGLGAYAGRGSMVLDFAPQGLKTSGSWTAKPITISVTNTAGQTVPRYYDAVEIQLEAMEILERTDFATNNGVTGTISANQAGYTQEMRIPI